MDEKRTDPDDTRPGTVDEQTPARRDFPGIDTVQPQELHEQRSDHAQAVDERDLAPIADSREQWAMHPDDYDLPGVDTPADYEGDDGGGLFF